MDQRDDDDDVRCEEKMTTRWTKMELAAKFHFSLFLSKIGYLW